ncbi:virulence RhuM family protein [bacterium]|nr:virulence RhuM family protein [bacterium]NUN46331.1 virulence protein RhuM/Fic/DOC family protein [bacterium]
MKDKVINLNKSGEIVFYRDSDSSREVEITYRDETIWLTQSQIADVFGTEVPAINKHIRNIISSGELKPGATISKMEIVQSEGRRRVKREVAFYSLDMIISVGYRVNSRKATQFRIWANRVLKEHILRGYTLNEQRLKDQAKNMAELQKAIDLIQRSAKETDLKLQEARGLLEVLTGYTRTFTLLNQFDKQTLAADDVHRQITFVLRYDEARSAIDELKNSLLAAKDASDLFGREKDDSFKGILGSVVQTFDGKYLYPSIEEQAAHLLYFVIKNHPFIDGNKRIGSFLFVWFLNRNMHLLRKSGEQKINDNALVALALLVAQSDPSQKDIMITLIINLINQ